MAGMDMKTLRGNANTLRDSAIAYSWRIWPSALLCFGLLLGWLHIIGRYWVGAIIVFVIVASGILAFREYHSNGLAK